MKREFNLTFLHDREVPTDSLLLGHLGTALVKYTYMYRTTALYYSTYNVQNELR